MADLPSRDRLQSAAGVHERDMTGLDRADRETVLDLLFDLQHDLGKYLRLPVAMLPAEAAPADLRAALAEALLRTRIGPSGTRSARGVWTAFLADLADRPGLDLEALRTSVETALAWETALEADRPLPSRSEILADLDGVTAAIRALIMEVENAP